MQKYAQHLTRYKLIYAGAIIQALYFISAFHTGWFNGLFTGDSLHHCCQGMDFYQVPNGAYAFWHGGSLTGTKLPDGSGYAVGHWVNANVYHPLFTLTIGSLLLLLPPNQAFFAWMIIKLIFTLAVTAYFFWSFRDSKYIGLAVFVLLANASQYLEIAISQYQAVLNAFLLLLLINVVKKQSRFWGAILYGLTLLVKPIGLLWLWVLLCKRHFKVALIGGLLFAGCTLAFLINGVGSYYTNNVTANILHPFTIGPNQIITLRAFLLYGTSWPDVVLQCIQALMLGIVLFFGSLKRVHVVKGIFLAVVYFLLFYDLVYEYHYTTLAPVLAVGLVCCPEFQTRLSRFLILLTCLPSAFGLLNLLHIDVTQDSFYGANPGTLGWQWMVVSKVGPVLVLMATVLVPDVVPAFKRVKEFWKALREANRRLEVFG